ncbi:hypothetical protein [Mangrovimonas sp. ST2L15]|uniref:hypothetical protein n=1 Tax=Mangrovimonas sp. ST2L15 TaxID=1645916 RepID=UPI0006B5AFF6|nr:hypothetical protein [Mangrovimonas sp. ST2L15]
MTSHSHHTKYINLEHVYGISRGDKDKILKYLNQFNELIPERLDLLNRALLLKNREQVRQIIHKMSPQLQFFGIQSISHHIHKLELDFKTMPFSELTAMVNDIILNLEQAIKEVHSTIIDLETN